MTIIQPAFIREQHNTLPWWRDRRAISASGGVVGAISAVLAACLLVLTCVALAPRPAVALPYSMIPGTAGIPIAPGSQLPSVSEMPSEDELAVLYALSQLQGGDLDTFLNLLGLDFFWLSQNLAISVYGIPAHRPEGTAYNAFIDISFDPTGDQIGCYANTESGEVVCIDSWAADPGYPLLLSPEQATQVFFPLMASTGGGGSGGGAPPPISCVKLREASPNADKASAAGVVTGAGAGIAFLANTGAGAAIYQGVGTYVAGNIIANAGGAAAVAAAGEAGAAVSSLAILMGVSAGAVVLGGIVIVAALAVGAAAYATYTAGMTPGAGCPGCGDGVDPTKFSCSANPGTDMCVCTPVGTYSGDSNPHDEDTSECHAGPDPDDVYSGSGWQGWGPSYSEPSGCSEWNNYDADSQECAGCWDDQPLEAETESGDTPAVKAYCTVCDDGVPDWIGTRTCTQGG